MHELRLNQRLQLVACQLQGPLASASGPCFFANKKNSRPACPGLPWNRSVAQFLSATHQRSLRTPLSPLSSRAKPRDLRCAPRSSRISSTKPQHPNTIPIPHLLRSNQISISLPVEVKGEMHGGRTHRPSTRYLGPAHPSHVGARAATRLGNLRTCAASIERRTSDSTGVSLSGSSPARTARMDQG
jgi:hypothetical protein